LILFLDNKKTIRDILKKVNEGELMDSYMDGLKKGEELKMVFETKSLDELNNLKFTTENNSLKLNGIKINDTNKQETEHGVTEELSTNN
jgi:hypothetical protein